MFCTVVSQRGLLLTKGICQITDTSCQELLNQTTDES